MVTAPSARTVLALILVGFVILATLYSVVTPLFEASDELWHYPMIKHLADHRLSLPVQDPSNHGPWRQEGGQPPLYYMIGAVATFWIDTSDINEVRRLNPHPDIGVVLPDGNANMVIHDAEREGFPWRGTVLAMHIVRFLSILMGAGTVFLTYRLGRELFPASPAIALAAAAFTAFNPMFLFVSAIINNDNLSTLLATLLLWMLIRLIKQPDVRPRDYVLLGLAAGTGMLSKFQIGFLLPLIALTLFYISFRRRDWRPILIGGLISGGLTILIAGWWYYRNYDLYGDATGINVFLDIVGRRAVPADLRQLWTERDAFMMSFWGFFGGLNVPMSDSVHTVFNVIVLVGIAGLVAALYRLFTGPMGAPKETAIQRSLILPRLLAVIWPVIVFISLISWTRQTWASQGRLWFSAIAPLNLWLAVGLYSWPSRVRQVVLSTACVVFVVIAAITPFATIRPAYTFDRNAYWEETTLELPQQRWACFAEPDSKRLNLCATYQPLSGDVLPGDYVKFSPAFTLTGDLVHDWSIFVHLVNEDGLIEAQRDVYPGGGLVATSTLKSIDAWNNLLAVRLPDSLYTPQTLSVYLGLYDMQTGDRMLVSGEDADLKNNRVLLGEIRLKTPPGDVPNPVDANFGGELRLLGYEITDRSLAPGDQTTLTLYWKVDKNLDTDYVISVQVIDPQTLTKAAQEDRPPSPPTTAWEPGERVSDSHTLTVFPDAVPGRYRVMVRIYPSNDAAHPLRVLAREGGQSEDFVWLNWMQIE